MTRPRLTEQDLTNMMSRAIQVKREQNRPLNLRSIGLTIDHAAESSADVPALVEEVRVLRQELAAASRSQGQVHAAVLKLGAELTALLSEEAPSDLDDLF